MTESSGDVPRLPHEDIVMETPQRPIFLLDWEPFLLNCGLGGC